MLLRFGGRPQFALEGHPRRVERRPFAVELHERDAVVEVVRGNVLDARARHRHRRAGLEARHAQHRDEQRRLVLADAAAVREVHVRRVQRVAFAFAHRNARIAHVVGDPVREARDLFAVVLRAGDDFVRLALRGGRRTKAAEILVHAVEPERFFPPRTRRGKQQFRRRVEEIDHVRLFFERRDVFRDEAVFRPAVLEKPRLRAHVAAVEFVLKRLADRDGINLFLDGRVRRPERHDVVELSAHRRHELAVGVFRRGVRRSRSRARRRSRGLFGAEQRVGKTALLDAVFEHVARIQSPDFEHDLPRAPIDVARGSGAVVRLRAVELALASVGSDDARLREFRLGGQRIVVVFHDAVRERARGRADLYSFENAERGAPVVVHVGVSLVGEHDVIRLRRGLLELRSRGRERGGAKKSDGAKNFPNHAESLARLPSPRERDFFD